MNILWLLCWFSLAFAKQVSHKTNKGVEEWTFDVKWQIPNGTVHDTHFVLDATLVKQDLAEPLFLSTRKLAKYEAKRINEWAAAQKGPKVTARAKGKRVSIRVKGKNRKRMKQQLRKAQQVGEQAKNQYLKKHGYTMLKKGIVPDHIRHIEAASPNLGSLVEALGGPTKDPRVFARKALRFTQSIPYEKRGAKPDKYRRPLSTLGRNKGDCDSKTVLFLALMHEAYPSMDLGIVYISGHAFGAIGIEPQKGDLRFRAQGRKWVAVEPVGPKMTRVGKVGGKSRRHIRTKRYQIRTL